MNQLYAHRNYLLLIILFVLPTFLFAQEALFDQEELINLKLEADLSTFLEDRGSKPSYHDAVLSYTDEKDKVKKSKVEIRVRGRFRRDKFVCNFPPIHVKFSKKKKYPPLFNGQRKIKLVTHCQSDQTILREYYLYKVYNMLTENSFKVRLAKITYVDTSGGMKEETRFAFFIESESHMAKRNGGEPLAEDIILTEDDVDREKLTTAFVFQYMIANKDFKVKVRQNLKIITNGEEGGLPIVIPYDFDWAGMVEAPYTKLATDTRSPVYYERRRFSPLCRSTEEFNATFEKFHAIRGAIENMYKNSPYLDDEAKKTSLKYYKNFFKLIKKSKKVQDIFVNSCNQK